MLIFSIHLGETLYKYVHVTTSDNFCGHKTIMTKVLKYYFEIYMYRYGVMGLAIYRLLAQHIMERSLVMNAKRDHFTIEMTYLVTYSR